MYKVCTQCNQLKSLEEFRKDKHDRSDITKEILYDLYNKFEVNVGYVI